MMMKWGPNTVNRNIIKQMVKGLSGNATDPDQAPRSLAPPPLFNSHHFTL